MIAILANLCYLMLIAIALPVLVWRMVVQGKYRQGWSQKFLGKLPERNTGRPVVWFHAVSVGEVLLLRSIITELTTERDDLDIVISTTTHTGQDVAKEKFPDCTVCYCPLDFSWAVRNGLTRVRPDLLVLVELELWPNLIREAGRQQIPIAIINGRLSEKSYRGYRQLKPLIGGLLKRFQTIAVQSETYADRFLALGADLGTVQITGSVKFDQVNLERDNPRTLELRQLFGLRDEETILIAGSTQSPEEEYVLEAYRSLKDTHPNLRLIVVPRHKERFEQVARLISDRGFPLLRRSRIDERPEIDSESHPVILLDTLGELGTCWGLADIAYVGGSLTNRGGQNMIEPAAYGAAVMFGPNTQNFRDVVLLLLAADAAQVVPDKGSLEPMIRQSLEDPQSAFAQGHRARNVVLPQQGATARTMRCLLELLPEPSKKPEKSTIPAERAA